MKQILLATDFSSSAANAMDYAMALAKVLKMEVCVMHAIHPTEGINNSTYNAIFIDDYYNNKKQALTEWAAKYSAKKKYKDVPVTTVCEVGFLKAVITRYEKHNQVNLLVMGVTGSTGIAGIVGSNASAIVSKVKIPTLVVPLESKFAKVPVITLATDFETRLSARDVNALNKMVKGFGSKKIQVLYVTENPEPAQYKASEKKLKELIKHPLEFNYIANSSPLNGIMGFIDTDHTDILCLVKHHQNIIFSLFTKSVVNQMINQTVKAILVLHE